MKTLVHLIRELAYHLSGFLPKKNRIVIGSWYGKKIGDNSFAILSDLVEYANNTIEIYWVGDKKNREIFKKLQVEQTFLKDVKYLDINSIKSFIIIATSRFQFISNGFQDLAIFPLNKRSILIQLWHGFPIKRIGVDSKTNQRKGFLEGNKRYLKFDYIISSSEIMSDRILSGFKYYGITRKKILPFGQPRTDIFYNREFLKQKNIDLRTKLGIPLNQRVVGYFPTFRDESDGVETLKDVAEEISDVFFIEKQHFVNRGTLFQESTSNFLNITENIDGTELLAIVDVLVTDVSSIYADFALLNRPIIHYFYDGDEYFDHDRGIYGTDFTNESCGPIVYSKSDLIKTIVRFTNSMEDTDHTQYINKYLEYENGSSGKLIVEKVFGK